VWSFLPGNNKVNTKQEDGPTCGEEIDYGPGTVSSARRTLLGSNKPPVRQTLQSDRIGEVLSLVPCLFQYVLARGGIVLFGGQRSRQRSRPGSMKILRGKKNVILALAVLGRERLGPRCLCRTSAEEQQGRRPGLRTSFSSRSRL
jgi:hypothetical protein